MTNVYDDLFKFIAEEEIRNCLITDWKSQKVIEAFDYAFDRFAWDDMDFDFEDVISAAKSHLYNQGYISTSKFRLESFLRDVIRFYKYTKN